MNTSCILLFNIPSFILIVERQCNPFLSNTDSQVGGIMFILWLLLRSTGKAVCDLRNTETAQICDLSCSKMAPCSKAWPLAITCPVCILAPSFLAPVFLGQFAKPLSSVQLLSHVQLFAAPWTAALQASLSITNSQNPLKLMSIELVMPSNHLILCRPLILLPSIFHSIRVFLMSQFFTSGGQGVGVSASASVLPMNTQDWSPLRWTSWISLLSRGLSRVFSNTTVQKHQFFGAQPSSQSNSHIHIWPLEKP